MRVLVMSPNRKVRRTLRSAVEQRAVAVLSRLSNRIDQVSVTLTDENGQRGGVDKRCRVSIPVRGFETVSTEGQHKHVLAAVDSALRKARRVILKRLKRRVALARKQPDAHAYASSDRNIALAS